MASFLWLLLHVIGGTVRRHRLRAAVQLLAIATGVSLGYAVHLINDSALAEFSAAVRQVSGQADAALTGPRDGFDEAVFARAVVDPRVRLASPVIDVELPVLGRPDAAASSPASGAGSSSNRDGERAIGDATNAQVPNRIDGVRRTLRILGVDALRLPAFAPQWLGRPAAAQPGADPDRLAMLGDGLFLSPDALRVLGLRAGDRVRLQSGTREVVLTVAGDLPAAPAGSVVGVMDIGYAQARLGWLGRLSRIDLVLADGVTAAQLTDPGQADRAIVRAWGLPADVVLETAEGASGRVSNLSRAYRVNLEVLAMVALFTGAFLVFSLQSQSVLSRRTQLAFLRIIGCTRGEVQRLLVAESTVIGVLGSAAGLAAGMGIAGAALAVLGGDLGGGYFPGVKPQLHVGVSTALLFLALGVAAAVLGGWLPAREAARETPARAIRTGSGLDATASRPPRGASGGGRLATRVSNLSPALRSAVPLLGLLAGTGLCLLAPPVGGIPVFAYAAVGLLLVAAIAVKPLVAPALFRRIARHAERVGSRDVVAAASSDGIPAPAPAVARAAAAWLAVTRVAANPRFAAIGAAGIVASFALMVSMLTMVASFRGSVDDWLGRVLPADLYVRAGPVGTQVFFPPEDVARVLAHPQVARAEFSRVARLVMSPDRAPVALLARPIDRDAAERVLPLAGAARRWQPGEPPPAWVSEAMVDLFGARIGEPLVLPIAGRPVTFMVLGVWRDYARQFGSVVIDHADYLRLTGDDRRTDGSIWVKPGANAGAIARELAATMQAPGAEFGEPGEIRALSLRIFDRSFAVTYVLQVAAIVIGLVGIAATFSAQAIARTREFGVLRHLGCTRGQVLGVLAIEGLLVTTLAVVIGLAAGLAIAWVLVAVVNPQSFHWTMDFRLPVGRVALLVVMLLVAATATAVIAGRRAVAPGAILAVREDW